MENRNISSLSNVFGIAMSPKVLNDLRQEAGESRPTDMPDQLCGTPYLVDPRLNDNEIQLFKSKKVWEERLKEQNQFDGTS